MLSGVELRCLTNKKAITTATHNIARIIYAIPTKDQHYFEERYRQRVIHNLTRCAQQPGMALVPVEPVAKVA